MTNELDQLSAHLERLTQPERLRLAAHHLEHGRTVLALEILQRVVDRLRPARTATSTQPEAPR